MKKETTDPVVERPVSYDSRIGVVIFRKMVDGLSIAEISLEPEMPDLHTMTQWIAEHEEFRRFVSHGMELVANGLVNDLLFIADNADDSNPLSVEKARLQCDVRMWIAERFYPERYLPRRERDIIINNSISDTKGQPAENSVKVVKA